MIEFTDEMHEAIDNALANGTPCIVGTASAGGDPNLGFKGSVMALDGSRLAYWERSMRTILEHIEENPKVCGDVQGSGQKDWPGGSTAMQQCIATGRSGTR